MIEIFKNYKFAGGVKKYALLENGIASL